MDNFQAVDNIDTVSSKFGSEWDAGSYIFQSEHILAPIFEPLTKLVSVRVNRPIEEMVVLDIGGGTGQWVREFVRIGSRRAILLEKDLEMLEYARRHWASGGVFERCMAIGGSAEKIPLRDACVDLIVSRNSMHLWSDLESSFREIKRVLHHGGTIFMGRGYGPTLPPKVRERLKTARKRFQEMSSDRTENKITEEPPSPDPEFLRTLAASVGFDQFQLIPDGKSFWIQAKRKNGKHYTNVSR